MFYDPIDFPVNMNKEHDEIKIRHNSVALNVLKCIDVCFCSGNIQFDMHEFKKKNSKEKEYRIEHKSSIRF